MTLATAKIALLDSSTLGRVALDYWSREAARRDKARKLLRELFERGVFIAFTLTHICELLRHGNEGVVQDRLTFLRSIPLIAWLRPYDRHWFPGSIDALLARELHAVVHQSAQGWTEIIEKVRSDLWETGSGSEMFVENAELWSTIRTEGQSQHEHEKLVASVARTHPAGIEKHRLGDLLELPRRPMEERADYMWRFAAEMKRQLDQHGDKRLEDSLEISQDFANATLRRLEAIDVLGGDPLLLVLESRLIPIELISPDMTVSEIGELAIYAERLKVLGEKLKPAADVGIRQVPLEALPSYVLERRLASLQGRADRIAGSDLGDSYIVPAVLYADGVEVDKRTFHHFKNICQADPRFSGLEKRFFRCSDYGEIPRRFD